MKLKTLIALLFLTCPRLAQELELEHREIRSGDLTYDAQVGLLQVPQLHEAPDRGQLLIAVAVLRSVSEQPEPPVFFLNGIPGGASGMMASELWAPYLETSDVVLIDQRGSGRSEPQLSWSRAPLRAELLLGNYAEARDHALEVAKAIRLFTAMRGLNLSAFNTRESARDIELVRKALAYDAIRIIGHSAGTHLGLEYLRKFPKRVAHFASLGTAGPGDIHSLPSRLDDSLRQVSELAAADVRIGKQMPDLFGSTVAVLNSLEQKPIELEVSHPDSGKLVSVKLGAHGLRFILLLDLGDPADFIMFPRMIHELEQGKHETVRWFVEKRFRQLCHWPALLFINRGASGATSERWSMIRAQAASSPFGLTRCNFSPELDQAFGIRDLGDEFRAPVRSQVPTLFLSGSLDANTPPARADKAREGFPNSTHLILENGGHDAILQSPALHAAIRAFFAGADVSSLEVSLPSPRFALLTGPDAVVQHPSLD